MSQNELTLSFSTTLSKVGSLFPFFALTEKLLSQLKQSKIRKFNKWKIFFFEITKNFCYANERCFCRISEGVCWSLIVLLDVDIARRSNSKVSRILSSHYFTIFGINSTTSFSIIISIFSVFWEFVWRRYRFTAWNRFSNHTNSVKTINLVDLNDYKPGLMFCIWHVQ